MSSHTSSMHEEEIRAKVRAGYGQIAVSGQTGETSSCCGPSCCCGDSGADGSVAVAHAVGYDNDELKDLPEGANMGLSCGNPVALATLKEGEVVVDLGSGGGFDVFIAGRKVGPRGHVIGVDMTAQMLAKARRNTAKYVEKNGFNNVEFRLGEIEHLPIADSFADVVISNCVINLSPNKPQVWREIARVLKPGGRAAVSDLALKKPLPQAVKENIEALVGCVSGASLISDIERDAHAAGLVDVVLEPKPGYTEAMESWQDPLYQQIIAALPRGEKIADYVVSLNISARRG